MDDDIFFEKYPQARIFRISTPYNFFRDPIFTIVSGNWDLNNWQNGSVTILNKTTDGSTIITTESLYTEVIVKLKDYTPALNNDSTLKKGSFSMQIAFIFNNGKQYTVRLHNTDKDGKYRLQNMPEGSYIISGWGKLAELDENQIKNLLTDGIKLSVKLIDSQIELSIDDELMKTIALGPDYYNQLAQIKLCMNGNKTGTDIIIPFELN